MGKTIEIFFLEINVLSVNNFDSTNSVRLNSVTPSSIDIMNYEYNARSMMRTYFLKLVLYIFVIAQYYFYVYRNSRP